jgi:amidophosphoribosyltransferase
MAVVENGKLRFQRFAPAMASARCFFEWVYFASVASEMDGTSVYQARSAAGRRLAENEQQKIDADCIVVPVPDTAKAAGDAYAYHLGIPCVEGIIRNRYVGRTFIQSKDMRERSARSKYTSLPSVLRDKRVFLVEDSIVRSTTLKVLAEQIRDPCGAREIHVRVACPPIVAPCFYGIDMSTLGELFAPEYVGARYRGNPGPEAQRKMALALEVDSLSYLPVSDLEPIIGGKANSLCLGCVTGRYPTPWGNKLMRRARRDSDGGASGRIYG